MRLTCNALLLSCAFALVASAGAYKSPPAGIEVRLVNHTGRPMLSFRPETGFTCEASVELTNDACLLTFTRRAAAASDATPSPFVHRIYRTPLFASRGFCVPLEPQQKVELGLAAQ